MPKNIERLQHIALHSDGKEVLAWLRSTPLGRKRTLGLLASTADSLELANHVYRCGAELVIAIEIKTYDWGENTGKLIIKLPTDTMKRQNLLSWSGRWASALGFEPTVDKGQQYLLVMLD